ncbi:hypothetical protein KUL72_28235 [Bradyrhizobium arachidis]|uniref:DUF6894 family protein n=1 Tax=Bradyrhizobium TaxID=374 RepID=UPI00216203AA|nr:MULTISPECIES: hypothetical protein [Bradyrhizobium]MDN4988050.1 hypothetical protein [Bradyrhizobium sp. WYCCWR 13022]UVO35310.1 hypothetical protein KUL72_28235 [Bradyrhizobium arachidis]
MERYFFDIQSGREFFADEEGLRLPNLKAAEVEAMQTLTGIARESVFKGERPDLAVEVRSTAARLFCVSIIYRNASTRQ